MLGKPVQTTGTGRDVINRMSKAQEITAKYNNWDCIWLKNICTAKEKNTAKRQPKMGKLILLCHSFYSELTIN
jgi:hypothetical protein